VPRAKPNWWLLACSSSSGDIHFDSDDRIGGQKVEILTVVIANFEIQVTTVTLLALSYLN